jgi:hypothetical protein
MAKTAEDFLRENIGQMAMQVAVFQARISELEEYIAGADAMKQQPPEEQPKPNGGLRRTMRKVTEDESDTGTQPG